MKNRILSLLLLLALTLSLFSSCFGGKPDGTTASTADPETDPLAVGDALARLAAKSVVIGRSDLAFDLSQDEIDALFGKIAELDALIAAGEDYSAFETLYDEVYETGFDRIRTQNEIIYLLWSCDLSDPLTEAAALYVDGILSELRTRYYQTFETVYASPFRDAFYDGWTPEEISYILSQAAGYTDETVRLSNANDELLVAFRALTGEEKNFAAESARIFLETAKNNARIAELLGYSGFMEYAYAEIYGRDFAPAEAEVFRDLFGEALMPLLVSLAESLDDGGLLFESLEISDYLTFYRFLAGEVRETRFTDLFDRYSAAVGEIAPNYLATYRAFWEKKNYCFVPDSQNAFEGAFTTYLPDLETPIVYFGPENRSPYAFIHEFGHYYVASRSENGIAGISFDLAETQSQGNEFLFTYWLQKVSGYTAEIADALAEYRIFETLGAILIASLVNDFECYVYTHLDELNPEDLDGVMISLCDGYGGYDAVKTALGYGPETYWRYVVIENPGYYISYALSAVPALDLYARGVREGFDAAVAAYETLATVDLDAGFLAALEEAGLASPFDADALTALAETLTAVKNTEE